MNRILTLFISFLLFSLFLTPQAEAAVLITQPSVSSGDNWTVNYNNGQTFEFDMSFVGQWPVLACKNTASGSISVLFQGGTVYVTTSSGFSQSIGGINPNANTHYKVICNNDTVALYADGGFVGSTTNSAFNIPSSSFVNNPRFDFIANGFTNVANFSIADSEINVAPTITALTVPTTQLQDTPVIISGGFTDTSISDTHTSTINWGDGTSSIGTLAESNGSGSVTGSHSYTKGGNYTVTLTVTDQNSASSNRAAQIHINLSPNIYRIQANGNRIYNGTGYFSDSDSSAWTGTVNYGDGSGEQLLQVDGQNHTFSLSHSYNSDDKFTITIKITDNQGQSSSPFAAISNLLVIQPNVVSGDSWTVNYNNGLTFEFDMNFVSQWPVLACKNSIDGNVSLWFQAREVYVKTSSGFVQQIGSIEPNTNSHYKILCNNDTVSFYVDGSLAGEVNDNSVNIFPNSFVDNTRFDFTANGFTNVTNFSISNSSSVITPTPTAAPTSTPTSTETPTPTATNTPTPTPVPTYSVTGTVFIDANSNGFQDIDETGFSNATVAISGDDSQTVQTNTSGNYSFNSLFSGNYSVTITTPNGYTLTTTNPVSIPVAADTTVNFGIAPIPTATPTNTPTPTLTNAPPVITLITAPVSTVLVQNAVNINATFTDQNGTDTHTASWNWGDGTVTTCPPNTVACMLNESNGSGTIAATHTYTASSVYTVTLTVKDSANESNTKEYQYITVYDPSNGWATGDREYTSPQGAVTGNPTASGKAEFGFTARYVNGVLQTVGNKWASVNFDAGNIDFVATSYQSLVLANGNKIILKGIGTLNGISGYSVLISALDGGNQGTSYIRYQIKNSAGTLIYDTQPDVADTANPTTRLVKGKIQIH
jgi:hypothetical protein